MSITQSVGGLLQSAAAATGVGTALAVQGEGSIIFTLSGTFIGTVTFQGSEDGTTFENIPATRISTGVSANTATTPGLYQASIAGMQLVRANITSYTSGSITVTAHAIPIGAAGGVADRVTQQASGSVSGTLQSAAAATGNGTPLTILGNSACVVTISGTFVGTVTFEGTEDGTNWSSLSATQLGTTTIGATAAAAGLYEMSIGGLQQIRARVSAYTSGSITATAHAVPLPFSIRNVGANLNTLLSGEDQTNNLLKVEQRFSYNYISTATTTVVKSGAGFLHGLTVEGGTTGTIILYDNTAGSGNIIASFDTTNALASYRFDVAFATGLTIVTSAATKLTVAYR